VPTLDDLAAQLATWPEWDDEQSLVNAVATEIATNRPLYLAEAIGEWKEWYFQLTFMHRDSIEITVTHGDGYTAVVGGGVSYHGYLDDAEAVDVIVAALRGQLTYVVHTRFGIDVADYFEVVGGEAHRLGYHKGMAGLLPSLIKAVPLLPESVSRKRISFAESPAITLLS